MQPDIYTLQANLYLLATDVETLRTHLAGYSDFGIYQECLHGVREPMEDFADLIRSGQWPSETLAKIFECYYRMEALARYPAEANNPESFCTDKQWNEVRRLAKEAADSIPEEKRLH
jgi:hypothetical protein